MMSVTFTKLFSSITASTVWCEDPETKVVWITMLAMSDREGRVFGSVPGLAAMARVSVAATEKALDKFLSPDRYSRTKEAEGRRVIEIDGGWSLINYQKYRELRDDESRKEYKREWIKKRRQESLHVDKVDRSRPQYTNADADADAEKEQSKSKSKKGASRARRVPTEFHPDLTVAESLIPDIDASAEAAKFRDWEFKTPRSDWPAVWRTWLSNCRESGKYARKASQKWQ